MPLRSSSARAFSDPVILRRDGSTLAAQAAGTRPGEEGGKGLAAAPPGEARMESLFETVGIALLLAIVAAAVWILIRKRL
ncbi:MAG TPA: hypothetical protein VEZ16_11425 [Microvirga sp.]|nr:hypothetical protein [Microvirga sp.]